MSLSTFALSFSIDIADAGHSLTQVSHPVHLSLFTTATKLSLHDNGFRWTDVNTGLAVNAHFPVDFRFFVLYPDSRSGALTYACLASGTFTGINDCNQFVSLHRIYWGKDKK